jgi:sigma-B regulation protein RsbU (phosphoserine phosphatase)
MSVAADPDFDEIIRRSRVLVVDDTAANRDLIRGYLELSGFTNIDAAVDGVDALERVAAQEPDIVILDLAMPRMNGFDVCKQLIQNEGRSLPILVQTAFGGATERSRAFEAGATDFITKPIHRIELLARVRLHLENRALISRLQIYHDRVNAELSVARSMQVNLLPSSSSLSDLRYSAGLDVAAVFEPSSELGGDLWGLRALDANRIALFSFDVCGHGVTAALNAFRLHTLINSSMADEDPAMVLGKLSDRLRALLARGEFATMLYAVIDLAANRLHYASAAAPVLALQTPAGETRFLSTAGLPLAVLDGQSYVQQTVDFPIGASLYLFSDALTETEDETGALWENEDLLAALTAQKSTASAEAALSQVIDEFRAKRENYLADDLTAICIRRL